MRLFLAGRDLQARRLVAGELRRPLARPADDDDHPSARPLEVEIRQIAIGGASARRGDALGRPGLRVVSNGSKSFARQGLPGKMVQHKLALARTLQVQVERQHVGQNRCVRRPRVLEVNRPLNRREIPIGHRLAAHLKPRPFVCISERVRHPLGIQCPGWRVRSSIA